MLRRGIIGRSAALRRVNRQLDDMTETLIEMDALQFRQLTEL